VQNEFSSSTTILEILQHFESNGNNILSVADKQPFVVFMNREIPKDQFTTTTLSKLGLSSGNGLFRLIHRSNTEASTSKEEVKDKQETMDIEPKPVEEQPAKRLKEEVKETPIESLNDETAIPTTRNIVVHNLAAVNSSHTQENLPDAFYEVTREDLAQLRSMEKRRMEEGSILKTKQIREREREELAIKYSKCNVRIRFPDRMQVQGTFYATEKTEALIAFVKDMLEEPDRPFYLYTTPPKTVLEAGKTLVDQRLGPSAIVQFAHEGSHTATTYIKSSVAQLVIAPVIEQTNVTTIPKPTVTKQPEVEVKESKKEEVEEHHNNKDEEMHDTPASGVEDTLPASKGIASDTSGPRPKWFQMGKKK